MKVPLCCGHAEAVEDNYPNYILATTRTICCVRPDRPTRWGGSRWRGPPPLSGDCRSRLGRSPTHFCVGGTNFGRHLLGGRLSPPTVRNTPLLRRHSLSFRMPGCSSLRTLQTGELLASRREGSELLVGTADGWL